MIKKIAVSRLRLGMHIHALDGPWLDHPFWKTSFVLTDTVDMQRLMDSRIEACWINTALGIDELLPEAEACEAQVSSGANPGLDTRATAAPTERAPSRELGDELHAAAAVCNRARVAVQAMLNEARMGRTVHADSCQPLVDDIASSVMRNPGALVSLARLKTQDDYSYMHSVAVCALMVALGRQLGMDTAACHAVGMAGLLHDVGKALMPQPLLNKPAQLNDDELTVIRTHPQRGHDLLAEGRGVSSDVLDVCLHHHERMDGKGYPEGLSAEALSQVARMGAVCDVYDAITSNRPYKAGWDPAEAISSMAGWKGHFDAAVFNAFVCSLGIYPTGSLVRLESGRVAVVVEHHAHALVSPKVRAFYSTRTAMRIKPVLVDLSRSNCADRIVAREPASDWAFMKTDELWLPGDLLQRPR